MNNDGAVKVRLTVLNIIKETRSPGARHRRPQLKVARAKNQAKNNQKLLSPWRTKYSTFCLIQTAVTGPQK